MSYVPTDAGWRAMWPCLAPIDRARLAYEKSGWIGLPHPWSLPLVKVEVIHRAPAGDVESDYPETPS